MSNLVFGRKVSSQQDVNTIRFLWGDDTRFSVRKFYCEHCGEDVFGYEIVNTFSEVPETTFCVHCDSILEKNSVWGKDALGFMPVGVKFTDGNVDEHFAHDFLPLGYSLDDVELHHCGEKMVRLDTWQKKNNVEETHYECEKCLFEKRLKGFKKEA